MSGPPINGRSVLPMAVALVVLLLAGLVEAERSGGLVSNLVDSVAGEESEPDADGTSESPEAESPEADPENEEDPEPAGDEPAEPREGADERRAEFGGPGCQAPALPPTPDDAVVLAEGCTEVVVRPGEERVVDGSAIVREEGDQPPACAAFGSYFSWRVTDEPPSGVEFTAVRQGARYHLAEGPEGDVSGMCGTVSISNPASAATALHLRYALLDCRPTGQAC